MWIKIYNCSIDSVKNKTVILTDGTKIPFYEAEDDIVMHHFMHTKKKVLVNKINELSTKIEQLEAENAELRSRLENSVDVPCKVGDTVFYLLKPMIGKPRIYEMNIHQIVCGGDNIFWLVLHETGDSDYRTTAKLSLFNTTVFLTREEAERALSAIFYNNK
jgi:hypothetical protein